jgi:hypothetical protein
MQTQNNEHFMRSLYKLKNVLTPVNEYVFNPQLIFSSTCADNNPATPRPMAHINSGMRKLTEGFAILLKNTNNL